MKFKIFIRSRLFSWIVLAFLMFSVIFVLSLGSRWNKPYAVIPNDGAMHLRFFDVGQGDATLIVASDGSDILIDGGPDGRIVEHLGRALPLSDRTLELVVLTHPHADHLIGLIDVLNYYKVEAMMMTGVSHESAVYRAWLKIVKDKGIKVIYPKKGDTFSYGETRLSVLSPKSSLKDKKIIHDSEDAGGGLNETSIVILAEYKETEALIMGDAGAEIEKEIIGDMEFDADILRTGHHGSKYSTSPEFVKEVKPKYAVISSGRDNKYGHPHYRTLRTLEKNGVSTHRTDLDGTISARSDGKEFKINVSGSKRKSCAEMNFMIRWLQYGCK